jgi:hypothetical protein
MTMTKVVSRMLEATKSISTGLCRVPSLRAAVVVWNRKEHL